ncbi:uncharacterized protein LOC124172808 isoform X4 [Ischnura elegans]|uniref:uncharacterized protein LOC124172808 isoform X4 n=1 Tax=Ischnura elegans TaxID=197161 RepID=UPI001ED8B0D4|nr:uncharacterized protein LOC124172808 isoform X4 [Ischnura elegans]
MSMTLFSHSMLTAVQGVPTPGTLMSGDGGNGSAMKYKSLVPRSLEDLGLVMEGEEENPLGWNVNSGGEPLPSNAPPARQPVSVLKDCAAMGCSVQCVVDPDGQVVGTVVKPMVLQPMPNGPRAGVIQGASHQYIPLSRHTVPPDGSVLSRQPVVLDRVWHKERLEFVANTASNPKYVFVPDSRTLGEDISSMGKVVRLERMVDGDRYIMNEIVLGPTVGNPPVTSMNPNGSSMLESALLGMRITMKDAFEQYRRKKAKERKMARKESTAKEKRGSKGVLSDLQQTSTPKRQRQRKKKAEEKGEKEKAAAPLKEKPRKTYSRKRGGGPVVEGEAEEIVVEVDLPMMLMDEEEDDESGDPVSRDAEEESEVVEVERGDPLAPSMEELAAVEKMRRKNGSGKGLQFTLLNWKKHLVLMPKAVKVLNGKTSAEGGHEMSSKGSLPVALKECFVRLERCDAPRTTWNNNARKAESSGGDGKEMENMQSKGPEDETIPSVEESPPPVSPSKTPRSQRQEADYWLKMLDQERREALEALEVVRKRLDEEKLACSTALMSVRTSVLEKEFSAEDINSTSLDERRWTLLEEEFRRRDALKRKSVSESSEVSTVEASPTKSPDVRETESETAAADVRSAKGGECQRVRRPNGSRKMLGRRKEDSPVPSAQEESTNADDSSSKLQHEDESCRSLASSDERLAVPVTSIRDPRIAQLRDKYLAEKSTKGDGWPRTKECYVKLERLDDRSVVKCTSGSENVSDIGAGESVVNGFPRMVVDSVEMQTLTIATNPVEERNRIMKAWRVCVQGRIGQKKSCETDPIVDSKSLPSPKHKTRTSHRASSPSQGRFLRVELNKVVVVTGKHEESTCVPEQESKPLPALEGPQTVKVPGPRTRHSSSGSVSRSQPGRPQLKECFVLLRRCDGEDVPTSNGCPPRKRRKQTC